MKLWQLGKKDLRRPLLPSLGQRHANHSHQFQRPVLMHSAPFWLMWRTVSPMKFGSQKQDLPAGTRTQGRNIRKMPAALSGSTLILFILSSRSLNVLKLSQNTHLQPFYMLNRITSLMMTDENRQPKIVKPCTDKIALSACLSFILTSWFWALKKFQIYQTIKLTLLLLFSVKSVFCWQLEAT